MTAAYDVLYGYSDESEVCLTMECYIQSMDVLCLEKYFRQLALDWFTSCGEGQAQPL